MVSYLCLFCVGVSSCLRFVARSYTTRVLLSVIILSSSDFSSIRRYFANRWVLGVMGDYKRYKLFVLEGFVLWLQEDAALAMALLTSLLGYPLMIKLPVMVCEAFSNWRSVLHIRLIRRA